MDDTPQRKEQRKTPTDSPLKQDPMIPRMTRELGHTLLLYLKSSQSFSNFEQETSKASDPTHASAISIGRGPEFAV
jgi:hypothetical protein